LSTPASAEHSQCSGEDVAEDNAASNDEVVPAAVELLQPASPNFNKLLGGGDDSSAKLDGDDGSLKK